MKKLFITLLLIITVIIYPKTVKAQGTWSCVWGDTICELDQSGCDEGCWGNDQTCIGLRQSACESSQYQGVYCTCPMPDTSNSPVDWLQVYYQGYGPGWSSAFGGYYPTLGQIANRIVEYIFPIAGLLVLLYLIYGGYMFLTSAGDPGKAQVAKGIITTALIGFLLIFAAYWIVQIVATILGLPDIQTIF